MTVRDFMELHPNKRIRVFVDYYDTKLKCDGTRIVNSNDKDFGEILDKEVVRFRSVNRVFDAGWFGQSPDFCIDEIK